MKKAYLLVILPLAVIVCVLSVVNICLAVPTSQTAQNTTLLVQVLDLQGIPLDNATVKVIESNQTVTTDIKGSTQTMPINAEIIGDSQWVGLTIVVQRSGYVPTVIVGCVVTANNNRTLRVRMYNDDGTLPYVCYVECPPDSYIQDIINGK